MHDRKTDTQLDDAFSSFKIFAKDASRHVPINGATRDWELKQVQFFGDNKCKEKLIGFSEGISNKPNTVTDAKKLFNKKNVVLQPTTTGDKSYWVGYKSVEPSKLGCVIINQNLEKSMNEIEIQVQDPKSETYFTLYTIKAAEGEDLGSQHSVFPLRVSSPSYVQTTHLSSLVDSSAANTVGATSIALVIATLILV